MAKFCPMCNQITNCTDNCKFCLEELEKEQNSNEQISLVLKDNGQYSLQF